jgi:hypothetical protein
MAMRQALIGFAAPITATVLQFDLVAIFTLVIGALHLSEVSGKATRIAINLLGPFRVALRSRRAFFGVHANGHIAWP